MNMSLRDDLKEHLIRQPFGLPPSPQGEGFGERRATQPQGEGVDAPAEKEQHFDIMIS